MASFFARTKSLSRRDRSDTANSGSTAQSGNDAPAPPGNVLVNAYKNAFGSSTGQMKASGGPRTTVDDPVSMHLLMETAIHDSADYTVLAPEEADALKRQVENLQSRIDATHRNLALQTKVRDAALSVGRLDPSGRDNNAEGQEAAQKCEELGRELWEMEKEQQKLQKRLLEHTAGVLQMTHKGYTKDMSVASLTTGSSLPDEDFEDFNINSALYKPYMGNFEDGIIDIDSFGGGGGGKGGGGGSMSPEQKQIIHDVEAKVERLNDEMHELMSRLDSRAGPPARARALRDDPDNVIEVLHEQTDALVQSIAAMREVQARQLHFVSRQIYESITGDDGNGPTSPTYAAPPQDDDMAAQISYMSSGVGKLKHLMNHMGQTVSSSGQDSEGLAQYESVVRALWDRLNAPEDDDNRSRASAGSRASRPGFSLGAFDNKVQTVYNRVSALESQKEVLTRQIQQQRELNASSDAVKDEKIADMTEQLRRLPEMQSELGHMEGEVARLQTELTMSQAELDGAYGTRAQRKAEAAADPALTARVTTLERELADTIADYEAMTKQSIEHERERETLESTIDTQRDRIDSLETQLSEERIHAMGGGAAGGSKTPATPATGDGSVTGGRSGTSAGVLKAEFRKMMKETKAEHSKKLKEEQEERRRLEGIIRGFKKEQMNLKTTGPGGGGGGGAAAAARAVTPA